MAVSGALREMFAVFRVRFDSSGTKQADKALDNLGAKSKKAGAATNVLANTYVDAQGRMRHANGRFVSATEKQAAGIDAGAKAATKSTNVLTNAVKGLGLALVARELGRGIFATITAASDASEDMNVLEASFGASTKAVTDFANATAKEVGRSEFQIRNFAGRIGALVSPAFKSMGDEGDAQTARVSSDFAKLAVDLSSFFNSTEEDAIPALRSGISGESEPLKRFGVDLTEAGMADALGVDKKGFAKMDRAEKTMARYQAIMIQTQNAQGDAAKTSDGFANASRAVQAGILDLATAVGQKLLPGVESVTRDIRDFVRTGVSLVRNTKIMETALLVAGAAAVFFGTRAIWAGRQTLLAWAKVLLPIVLVGLAVEDVLTTMDGGASILNDFMEWITGVEGAGKIWTDTIEKMGAAFNDLLNGGGPALDEYWNAWVEGANTMKDSLIGIFKDLKNTVSTTLRGLLPEGPMGDLVMKTLSGAASLQGKALATMANPVGAAVSAVQGVVANSSTQTVNVNVNGGSGSPRDIGKEAERAAKRALAEDRRKVTQAVGG